MNFVLNLVLAGGLLGFSLFAAQPAMAGETVQFTSPDIQPTPFAQKRAKAKGVTLEPSPGITFSGLLTRPQTAGPNPAVVILTSSGGRLASHVDWAEMLAESGYVTLLVDSFGARGGTNFLDTKAIDMTVEGFAAFTYLAGLADVDGERIGIMGFSMGGSFVFPIIRSENRQRPDDVAYRAAVAFYPTCNLGYDYDIPVLVLFGTNDTLSSLGQCQLLAGERGGEEGVSLFVYEGVSHFFDSRDYAQDADLRGADWKKPLWFDQHHYDAAAHADSIVRTVEFLDQYLK